MINTLTLMKPLFLATDILLRKINRICTHLDIAYFIAGATAREILIHNVYGRSAGRRTRDIDFAVFVEGWDRFELLKQAFRDSGAQSVKGNHHRMVLDGVELDIIPFGGVTEGNHVIWPPDRTVIMAVDGFAEAFKHAVYIQLECREIIPFCSVPGLALLKLFAWRDRGSANGKDATDLFTIVSEYGVIEKDRIYESTAENEDFEWDPVRMGAFLLGNDIAMMSGVESMRELLKLDDEKLTDAIYRQNRFEHINNIEQIMDDFWRGIRTPCGCSVT